MIIYKKVTIPDDVDLYFVGDIHGDYPKLLKILKINDVEKTDYIIGTGDIVDRGKQIVPCCYDFLFKPNYDMVLGNHELMMLNCKDKATFIDWTWNGGEATLHQLGETGVQVISQQMLEKFPVILEIEHRGMRFGVIHAEIPYRYNVTDWQQIIELAHTDKKFLCDLVWSRQSIKNVMKSVATPPDFPGTITGIDYVIHGHTGVTAPCVYGNRIWIDTAFMNGSLTLAKFDYTAKEWMYFTDKEEWS